MSEEHRLRAHATNDETSLIQCGTSKGPIEIRLVRQWSPKGYDRATELFDRGYYDESHFFRNVPNFLVQFGITYSSDQELRTFADSTIQDDPQLDPRIPFDSGVVSYAGSGPNSRTSQMFFAYGKIDLGHSPWETPLGYVESGMEDVVRKFYTGYGDMPPWGKGPEQGKIRNQGLKYMEENFPLMDKFTTCTVTRYPYQEEEGSTAGGAGGGDGEKRDAGAVAAVRGGGAGGAADTPAAAGARGVKDKRAAKAERGRGEYDIAKEMGKNPLGKDGEPINPNSREKSGGGDGVAVDAPPKNEEKRSTGGDILKAWNAAQRIRREKGAGGKENGERWAPLASADGGENDGRSLGIAVAASLLVLMLMVVMLLGRSDAGRRKKRSPKAS